MSARKMQVNIESADIPDLYQAVCESETHGLSFKATAIINANHKM